MIDRTTTCLDGRLDRLDRERPYSFDFFCVRRQNAGHHGCFCTKLHGLRYSEKKAFDGVGGNDENR